MGPWRENLELRVAARFRMAARQPGGWPEGMAAPCRMADQKVPESLFRIGLPVAQRRAGREIARNIRHELPSAWLAGSAGVSWQRSEKGRGECAAMRLPSIVALALLAVAAPVSTFGPKAASADARPIAAACGSDSYINSSGHCVHRPIKAVRAPVGASARCRDGTYSFSEHRRGTCSRHGGVAQWLRG